MHDLHCGACMEPFETIEALNEHLEDCPAAMFKLPLIYQVWGGNDKVGHPLASFIENTRRHNRIIKRYAYAISDEMDSLSRASIHAEMCEKLGINYNEFKPFESSEITEIPSRKESERILWAALFEYANKRLVGDASRTTA